MHSTALFKTTKVDAMTSIALLRNRDMSYSSPKLKDIDELKHAVGSILIFQSLREVVSIEPGVHDLKGSR